MPSDDEFGECCEAASWPQCFLDQISDSSVTEENKVVLASTLSKSAINLHDGKDYIDDSLPLFNKVMADKTLSMSVRCRVATAAARMLAHGWGWEAKDYKPIVGLAADVLRSQDASLDAKHAALQSLDQIVDPDNGSETDQEEKSLSKVVQLFGSVLCQEKLKGDALCDALLEVFEPLLSEPALASPASALVAHIGNCRKRPREGKGSSSLIEQLEKYTSGSAGTVFKGLLKKLLTWSFDVRNDVPSRCDLDLKRLSVALQRILNTKDPDGLNGLDRSFKDEEKCKRKHFDDATAAFVMTTYLLLMGGEAVALPTLSMLQGAWIAHRFHLSEFEEVEVVVCEICKRVPNDDWVASGTVIDWICCAAPTLK